jgi:hypothetical protein
VIKKGYSSIDRKTVLSILDKRKVHNEIFNDFKEYLTAIENQTNSYNKFENITTDWKAGEGFFIKLQELISEWTDWRYVANQMGGFLVFGIIGREQMKLEKFIFKLKTHSRTVLNW